MHQTDTFSNHARLDRYFLLFFVYVFILGLVYIYILIYIYIAKEDMPIEQQLRVSFFSEYNHRKSMCAKIEIQSRVETETKAAGYIGPFAGVS